MVKNILKKFFFCLLLFTISFSLSGQEANCYRLYLTDKNDSPYSESAPQEYLSQRAIEKRERFQIAITEEDLPVNPDYLQAIKNISPDIRVLARSKWFNTVTIYCPNNALIAQINALSFVVGEKTLPVAALDFMSKSTDKLQWEKQEITYSLSASKNDNVYDYGYGYGQIAIHNGHLLHNEGFAGKNMLIAVFDAGWNNFDTLSVFQSLYENEQILGTIDLIPDVNNVYTHHSHGTSVVSTMASHVEGRMVGTAPEADYFFIRSEHPQTEQLIEEDFWAYAAELADSIGADVINSSLGYTTFTFPSSGWSYEQCDGVSSIASLAATKAGEKGIIPCISAGNEGNDSFYYIGRPADAFNVLTVGGIDVFGEPAPFTSHGPSYDGRIKPDIMGVGYEAVAYLENGTLSYIYGTSFSSPIVAGLTACLWQSLPRKTALQLMEIIRQSAHLAHDPDNLFGHGIPDFHKAYLDYMNDTTDIISYHSINHTLNICPNPCTTTFSIISNGFKIKEVLLFDLSGKLVKQISVNQETNPIIDISSLGKGFYIGRVFGKDGEIKAIKVVRQ